MTGPANQLGMDGWMDSSYVVGPGEIDYVILCICPGPASWHTAPKALGISKLMFPFCMLMSILEPRPPAYTEALVILMPKGPLGGHPNSNSTRH